MVTTLASLNADKVVEEKAADLKPYGLNMPTLEVQIKRKDGKTDGLLIGDDTPTGGIGCAIALFNHDGYLSRNAWRPRGWWPPEGHSRSRCPRHGVLSSHLFGGCVTTVPRWAGARRRAAT